ncbi:MAG: DNA polymerase III subunit alpha [Gammaproteobacteria bacterium]|nr:DNA polymerase III subunit alpha [Gammaproteobacteria bacterium]
MSLPFVHLRVHTEFSLSDSVVRVKELMSEVATAEMPAVALTDQGNLFAMVKFYRAALAAGVQPLLGADLRISALDDAEPATGLTLICQDRQGYLNLSELITRSFREGQERGVPIVQRDWLHGHTDGLIAISHCRDGEIARLALGNRVDEAEVQLGQWLHWFGDRFYFELQRTGRDGEAESNEACIQLAAKRGVPVVATNDVRFLRKEEFEAHETRVSIHDGRVLADPRRPKRYSEEQYLKTDEEMRELFADLPEAIDNSARIARRCGFGLHLGEYFLPEFPIPEGFDTNSWLRKVSEEGLEKRLASLFDTSAAEFSEQRRPYDERLNLELDVIIQMGFPGYFLIVADFIEWARNNDVPVGPGRGSGAGSLVAYSLGITDLDPLEYDLLFERFLNPERVSMPDFDVDFCMEGRDRVIDYVAQKYGRDQVSQIITYGTMAARAVVRDVGRVLGHPYGFTDRVAKLIPFEVGMTLEKALEDENGELVEVYRNEEEVRELIDRARELEGLSRNAGKHAGGVVIAPTALTDFTPLYCEQGSESTVTQLDKDDVESVGLVKFDFLGLRTLTIIDWALDNINELRRAAGEPPLDIGTIPMDDQKAFALLKRYETTAVFQLESRGMKDLIRRLLPDSFEDIIALVALFRPGPLQSGMVDDFINRKHGRQRVEYPHPALEPILKPTYGVILYQEQVMQIAQELAGYSLGAADLLRRAMGKKKPEEMAKQREIFMKGAGEKGVEEETATYIFDLMEKFAGYGFNKSHSAAYALLSYQTAWLKAHYPAAFMAAVLSSDMDHTDKVVGFIDECENIEVEILPPDVNESHYAFTVHDENSIRYGLGAIKGVGRGVIETIVAEREASGPFDDLDDFCRRVDLQKINRRTMEALIRAGATDALGPNRASLMAHLPTALQSADQRAKAEQAGQDDMFGLAPAVDDAAGHAPMAEMEEWSEEELLAGERETLGLFLSGHPIDRYEEDLKHLVSSRIGELVDQDPPASDGDRPRYGRAKPVKVAGLVIEIRKRGGRVSLTLDDRSGRIEATLFEDAWNRFRHFVTRDAVVILEGKLQFDDFINAWRITAKEMRPIEEARQASVSRIDIRWTSSEEDIERIARLREILEPHRGGPCRVSVAFSNASARGRLLFAEDWQVEPDDGMVRALEALFGREHVRLVHGRERQQVLAGERAAGVA